MVSWCLWCLHVTNRNNSVSPRSARSPSLFHPRSPPRNSQSQGCSSPRPQVTGHYEKHATYGSIWAWYYHNMVIECDRHWPSNIVKLQWPRNYCRMELGHHPSGAESTDSYGCLCTLQGKTTNLRGKVRFQHVFNMFSTRSTFLDSDHLDSVCRLLTPFVGSCVSAFIVGEVSCMDDETDVHAAFIISHKSRWKAQSSTAVWSC